MNAAPMLAESDEGAIRDHFHRLANAREDPACLVWAKHWLLGVLAEVDLDLAPLSPPVGLEACESGLSCAPDAALLAFHAPLALLEGAWLQAQAVAGNGHHAANAKLFAAYLALLGQDEARSPAFAYRGWLAGAGVSLPHPCAWRFAQDPRIGVPALHCASVWLALGQHSANLFPEALGFTLAYVGSASPWRLPALPRRCEVLQAIAGHGVAALQAYLAGGGEWARVRRGHALYQIAEAGYLAGMGRRDISLKAQVAGLFRRKRRFARGYHADVKLAGRPLEDWLADTPFDADAFLAAFAASPFVQGQPGKRLFDRLTAFGGPMFGVFGQNEMALIDAWLEEETATPFSPLFAKEDNRAEAIHLAGIPMGHIPGNVAMDNRTLFHRLLRHEASADSFAAARRRVEQALAPARHRLRRSPHIPLSRYSAAAFAAYIEQIHAQAVARHRPLQAPPTLSRADYAWGIRQFAPAILVDGCWLQHQGEASQQDSRVHRLLYRIYAEELGVGQTDWNHPKIYLDLLDSLQIELPAMDSVAFARDASFLDSAFDLPSYLLAISQFPASYFAELLGLNLAIELSGLGAGYLRLAEECRYWDINPLIVTLHLSIDNLASGHAAMAVEAIQLYLDGIRLAAGEAAMQEEWQRIWSGYLSLRTVTDRFKRGLLWGLGKRYAARRLGMLMGGGVDAKP